MVRVFSALLCLAVVAGCSDDTAVYVVVDAQDLGRVRGATLRVRAFGSDGEVDPMPADWSLGDGAPLPRVIRLTPLGGDASRRWALRATLEDASGVVRVESQIVGGFVAGERRFALLCLEDACFDTACTSALPCDPSSPDAACQGCSAATCQTIEAELVLSADGRCPPGPPLPEGSCGDGRDDDFDGAIDCADSDCEGLACEGGACSLGSCVCPGAASETTCTDAIDEDCDGATDCTDPDCAGQACDDGQLCTIRDTCSGTTCTGSPCDDGVACTVDTCDGAGCQFAQIDTLCDDGVACTIDTCDPTGCQHAPTDALCVDTNECTSEACDPAGGCVIVPLNGVGCSDEGNPCTDDVCVIGTCMHLDKPDGTSCGAEHDCCVPTSGGVSQCSWMGSREHCGGCNQDCRPGNGCIGIQRGGITRYLCDCSTASSGCPVGQRCRMPVGTADDRCQCESDAECRNGPCQLVADDHNYCTW